MPKRRPVELTEHTKKRLAEAKPSDLGRGAARKAAEGVQKRKSRNKSALDAAQKAFNAARRS